MSQATPVRPLPRILRSVAQRTGEQVRGWPARWRNHRSSGVPIPPAHLIHQVAGTADVVWFLQGGARAAQGIRESLERQGQSFEDQGTLLDFGCGTGRVLRHWTDARGLAIHGCDHQPGGIAWCRRHLPFATVAVNRLEPPLPYENAAFGLVYALSVFTHLSGPAQAAWMAELRRVVRPGGWAYLTLHGDAYRHLLDDEQRTRYDAGHLVVRGPREGSNHRAAFHPPAYLLGAFTRGWTVVEHLPSGAPGNPIQDALLLRRPA